MDKESKYIPQVQSLHDWELTEGQLKERDELLIKVCEKAFSEEEDAEEGG